ncbi:MAG: ATP-binding cassette domain-containing protein [Candidatus Poribacteria bacterium]|nr:ATP-binding cassette domain-containing protein [Candidatus Poribacteria bacterium]
MIEVRELTKSYGPTLAVNHVSFDAHAGEVVGFIGPNGAGKTTTMRILTCYLTADAGSATVAGYDVLEHAIDVRKNVGYLPESAPLYADMGVVEYLKFMTEIREIPKSQRKERLRSVIDICGLEGVIQKDIGELSKGYRQRVGLAQSLIHDPPILILDEPTSGLDPSQTIEIRNLIKEIGKEKLVLFSTHILPEVAATCTRILIIHRGEIVANGTLGELVSQVQSEDTLQVAIRGSEEVITSKLKELDGITGVQLVKTDDGIVNYEIKAAAGGDNATEAIYQAAVQNEWGLIELRKESVDLEDVFLHFTSGQISDKVPATELSREENSTEEE